MNLTTKKISSFHFLALEILSLQQTTFLMVTCFGRGGFGNVYKVTIMKFLYNTSVVRNFLCFLTDEIMQGMLPDNKVVAIKRLGKGSRQGAEEFRNEVVLIAKLQHRNLVRLLGCCIHGDERLLIYEYLPNKSLDCFIFGS